MDSIYNQIKEERKRQDEKWGEQNHSPEYWLVILMEEVGEASHEVCGKSKDYGAYQKEMVQVASVAVAALESFDRQRQADTPQADSDHLTYPDRTIEKWPKWKRDLIREADSEDVHIHSPIHTGPREIVCSECGEPCAATIGEDVRRCQNVVGQEPLPQGGTRAILCGHPLETRECPDYSGDMICTHYQNGCNEDCNGTGTIAWCPWCQGKWGR